VFSGRESHVDRFALDMPTSGNQSVVRLTPTVGHDMDLVPQKVVTYTS
jgi:hypothetical protein